MSNAWVNPTVSEFKDYFARDFPYGTAPDKVNNADIEKAMQLSDVWLNADLFGTQEIYSLGFLLLSAHYLVQNFRALPGLTSQFSWLQSSKSVGNVSESFAIPDRILANPEYAWLTTTNYGAQFLMIILPQLSGQMYAVFGGTNP